MKDLTKKEMKLIGGGNSGQSGDGVNIQVRAPSSLNSSSNPLYVLDGVPIEGSGS